MDDIELRPPREARFPLQDSIDSPILKPMTQAAIVRDEDSSSRSSFDSEMDDPRHMEADQRTPSPCTEDMASTRTSSDTTHLAAAAPVEGATSDEETTVPARAIVRPTTSEWYSDLEVVASIPHSYDTHDKMTVIHDVSTEKIIHYGDDQYPHHHPYHHHAMSPMSPSTADPVPAYPPSVRGVPLTTKGDDNYAEWEQNRAMSETKKRKTCCGMTTRTLSFVIIGLMATILILLAIILGTTLTMDMDPKDSNKSTANNATTAPTVGILSNSGLTAVNWTDPADLVDRTAVFYQHTSNAIMVAVRDSVSNLWTTTNLTAQLLNTTGAATLDVLPGTPLAAVTQRYQVSLYYLTSSFEVSETWTYTSNVADGEFPGWASGSLATSLRLPGAMNGSDLAAEWMVCTNCTNSLLVTWQGEDGNVEMANLTDNTWVLNDPIESVGSPFLGGTALSLRSGVGNETLFGTDANAAQLYVFNGDGLVDFVNGPESNFSSWDQDTANTALSTLVVEDPSPALAAITFGSHGWSNSIVNYLAPNGTIVSSVFNGTAWTSGTPTIEDTAGVIEVPEFTNIAATQQMKVYGLSNGTIYEYDVDESDPLSWKVGMTVVSYSS